jgi:hypothetical protein
MSNKLKSNWGKVVAHTSGVASQDALRLQILIFPPCYSEESGGTFRRAPRSYLFSVLPATGVFAFLKYESTSTSFILMLGCFFSRCFLGLQVIYTIMALNWNLSHAEVLQKEIAGLNARRAGIQKR